jgi:hypothetical protein
MRIRTVAITLSAALALAACDRGEPEQPPVDNNITELPEEVVPMNAAPPPVENVTNEVAPAPPPAFSDDEQMRDDADATGLTARLPQGETETPVEANQQH